MGSRRWQPLHAIAAVPRQNARMAILVGTTSWTDKTLIDCGRFYPRGCTSAEARLVW